MSVVHNTLLYNNFLTEIEKGSRYALTKTNRNAIQTFFQKHKIEFEGNRLTNIEYALILGSSGIQGSRVEALLAQVMGSLAFLMDTLSQIPHLENSVKEEIAEHVMKSLILRERIGWNVNRLHQIQESIPKPYNYLEEVAKTCMVIDSGEQQNLLLDKVLRDEEILKKLHIVRTLLTYIVTAFFIWEEKIE